MQKWLQFAAVLSIFHTVLIPQGKNITLDETHAIGDMLSSVDLELPVAQEYNNDLTQPQFLCGGVPESSSSSLALPSPPPQPNDPISQEQWAKADKMVAFGSELVFVYYV